VIGWLVDMELERVSKEMIYAIILAVVWSGGVKPRNTMEF
jgi:hypothetical protein